MNTPKNLEHERYWAWIRENFPDDEEKVRDLWRELESLRSRIVEIEGKLVKYAQPRETK